MAGKQDTTLGQSFRLEEEEGAAPEPAPVPVVGLDGLTKKVLEGTDGNA